MCMADPKILKGKEAAEGNVQCISNVSSLSQMHTTNYIRILYEGKRVRLLEKC